MIAKGVGYHDYIMPFAPKPYLINAGIQDFFSIRGTRETARKMEKIYSIFGKKGYFKLFESDEGHGYTRPRREATYAWLGKFLGGLPEAPMEFEMQPEPVRRLWSTPTGQVSTSYSDAETIGSLNLKSSQLYRIDTPHSAQEFDSFVESTLQTVTTRTGYRPRSISLRPETRGFATPVRGSKTIERLTLESEPGITLPALLIRPQRTSDNLPVVLYLPHRNKAWDLNTDISALVTAGYTVLAVDLRGKGETERKNVRLGLFYDWFSLDWDIAMMALQLDKPLMTMRTQDIVRSVDLLSEFNAGQLATAGIVVIGKGSAAVPLLHAALIDERISGVVLENGLVSWSRIVSQSMHRRQFDNILPGALTEYDLPVLAAALAPRPLALSSLVDPMGNVLDPKEVRVEYKLAADCYRLLGKSAQLTIMERPQGMSITQAYQQVLKTSE
jgi:cephalosporin-C deacetylase-like acetyl esterase